ncbi:MAG: hypothetical protein IH612_11375, partial [Desulfofustis sp.]|nr:hypothetical protein [Desulfofustis sp.]
RHIERHDIFDLQHPDPQRLSGDAGAGLSAAPDGQHKSCHAEGESGCLEKAIPAHGCSSLSTAGNRLERSTALKLPKNSAMRKQGMDWTSRLPGGSLPVVWAWSKKMTIVCGIEDEAAERVVLATAVRQGEAAP